MTPNRRNRFRTLLAALLVLVFAAGGAMAANRPNAAIVAEEIEWCWPWSDEESRHDLGGAPPTFTFPATNLNVIVELALGADLTANPDSWVWTDVSTYVRHQDRIVIHRGRGDEWTEVGPSQASLTLDNRDGRFTRLNVFGTWYGQLQRNTPLRIRVDMHTGAGPQTRFTGYVTKWPPRWDKSGNNKWTSITADGIFRRLGQGDPPSSALFRSITGSNITGGTLLAYWPAEDGKEADHSGSGLAGGPPLNVPGGLTLADDDTLPGSLPLSTRATGTPAVTGSVHIAPTTGSSWTYDLWIKAPVANAGQTELFMASGEVWEIFQNCIGEVDIFHTTAGGVTSFVVGTTAANGVTSNTWHNIRLVATQNGADTSLELIINGVSKATGTKAGTSIGVPKRAQINDPVALGTDAGWAHYGHVSVWDGIPSVNFYQAGQGHVGEQAHERIARLCAEEQIPNSVTGTTSAKMGAQPAATLLSLLREAEAADLGVLYETLDGRVGYRTNADRYNRGALFTLDYSLKHIRDWAPEDDDQKLKNDITVSRPSGSFAHAEDATSISKEGRAKQPHTANVQTDSQLTHVGGWLKHLGIWDELRFPQVGFQLHRHTSLINAWLAQDLLTHRLDILNLPTPVPATTAQALEGYTETIGSRDWEVVANLAPSGTYTVAVYDDGLSRYGAASTVLAAAINATATSVAVTATGETWITTATYPAEFPINVTVGGLTYSCTAITGTSPNYTLTLVRLATDKAHASAAAVAITDTGRYGL